MNVDAHWLDERRAQAANRFAALGVPHRRVEDWKYSDLKSALDGEEDGHGHSRFSIGDDEDTELFLIDVTDGEAPDWVRQHFGTLPQNAMSPASFAQPCTCVALRVPRGKAIAKPLPVMFGGAGPGRLLVVLEDGAS